MSKEKALDYIESHKKFIGHPTHAGGLGQVAVTVEDAIKAIDIATASMSPNPPAGYRLMRQGKTIIQKDDLLWYSNRWNKAKLSIGYTDHYPICRSIK